MDLRQQQQRSRAPERPAQQPATAQYRQSPEAPARKSGLSKTWKIIIGVVATLALAGFIAYSVFGIGSPIDRSKYQAVFLTNGQVYFGKLNGWGGAQPTLTDVWYFQATGDQTGADAENPEDNASTQTLIKLGEEIHSPTDKLILNREAILFVENIEDDGQVVDAIKNNSNRSEN